MSNKKSVRAVGLFVLILILSFGAVTWFTAKTLKREHEIDQSLIDDAEWNLLYNTLILSLNQAKYIGQDHVDFSTYRMYQNYENIEEIAYAVDNYFEPDNFIRTTLVETVEGLYFNDIVSDNTDGFIVKGYTVATDNSRNCSSFGSSRSFDNEMLMHANPELALEAFNRIALGDVENYNTGAIDRPIFFQFVTHPDGVDMQSGVKDIPLEHQGKLGIPLISYDMLGLKDLFYRTKSWEKTFWAFEFVTPTYIFDRVDLADRAYIENGIRTGIERISVNVVFNFKTVIDHNPILKRDLAKYDKQREIAYNDYIIKERILLLAVFLLGIICFISMHYTNKFVEDS